MNQRWILVALYAFFIAGAMWNSLRALQPLMMMATPVVILVIAIGAFALTYQINLKSVGAGAAVMALVFLCEASGVNLGFPFGDYAFTNLLGPKLLDVPLVIPFIWIGILVPSWIASGKFLKYKHIVVASVLVTAFDAVMEFAADALDLWHWKGGLPTELNYISWFVISYVSLSLLQKYTAEREANSLVPHLLICQLLYFLLTDVGMRFVFPLQ